MKSFTPRPCQVPMIEFMCKHDRCSVFASPGTGKTAATLAALLTLSLVDDDVWPVLVVAPKRVANQVWDSEVEDWADFKHLRVSKIVGTAEDRYLALRTPADIYAINLHGLKWLDGLVGGNWPFKTVIVDESTLIKNHRCRFQKTRSGKWALYTGGGVHASSLVKHAPRVKRWINLTGTPTPNGLVDLWGQQWPVDFGDALGSSFSGYSQMYFRQAHGSTPEQQRLSILPGCEGLITRRMKPTSLVIDAYDWFDIEKPVELNVKFKLPGKARKVYDDMHAKAVTELQSGEIASALSVGGSLMKCRQIASGHLKDDEGKWHTIHKEKQEVLGELVDSLAGAPLLVAYWFVADRDAIQAAFKHAVVLPSDSTQADVMRRWNEGKIPMLLVHPQSAGHGLSLQHGGHHLCIYTLDWNAEYYEQVIERLGPTRQAQSGYKRLVYIHRLIAERTWDEVIATKLAHKISTSDAVKAALQEEA